MKPRVALIGTGGTISSIGRNSLDLWEYMDAGRKVGMNGTPGFYVNGVVLSGAQPLDAFVEVIDAELARAGQTVGG